MTPCDEAKRLRGSGAARYERGAEDGEAQRYRTLERKWQNEVGYALLDKLFEAPGSAAVFHWQWDRLISRLDLEKGGVVIEIGCGKGHFLRRLRALPRERQCTLVGVDLSRAVFSLPPYGLPGAQADGEFLPFRDACATSVFYGGSLHHIINYPAALREAIRILKPGGLLMIYEPVSSRFSQLVHRLLDPVVFRKTVYESPIDIRYKGAFRYELITDVLRSSHMELEESRSDFLAYPFTGCYAGSPFVRSERLMRLLMAIEDRISAFPLLNRIASVFAWRFTILARKPAGEGLRPGGPGGALV